MIRRCKRRVFTALLSLSLLLPAIGGADGLLPVWQLEGKDNRVYLVGSVHLLRESDLPLPAGILRAYDDAEAIVMELDTDDLDVDEAQAIAIEMGMLTQGGSLAALLGSEAYRRAETLAAAADVPLDLLSRAEPWLAAITVEQMLLARLGFSAAFGLEQQITGRAIADGKTVSGLETIRQQLDILDTLPAAVQRTLLLQALEEGADMANVMDTLIAAWRRGDTALLERTMLDDMRDHPVLHERLVVARNRDWATQVTALLDDTDDYLVVVGSLHLVGEEGLPALLTKQGFKVRQLQEDFAY